MKKRTFTILLAILSLFALAWLASTLSPQAVDTPTQSTSELVLLDGEALTHAPDTTANAAENAEQAAEPTIAPEATAAIDEAGTYTGKEDVSLYLFTYGRLPQNFITKNAARALGWNGGGLDDLLGFAVDGRLRDTQNCVLWNKAWVHPIAIERRKSEEAKYRDFEKDGDLVVVERPGQDLEELAALCKQICDWGLLARIGLDPERTHKVVFQALIDAGDYPAKLF